MSPLQSQVTNTARTQQILDAASDHIVRYGYDKTTMSDIAEQAGLTRAIVYLHFSSKEALFEALLFQETQKYVEAWLDALERDPRGGTISGIFRSALSAVHRSPFLSALLRQDRQVFGQYLRRPGNLFASMQSRSLWPETLKALQNAEAVRTDIEPAVVGHILNALAFGILAMEADTSNQEIPSFDAIVTATADILDRALTPDNGGDPSAGKAILQQIAQAIQYQLVQENAARKANKDT